MTAVSLHDFNSQDEFAYQQLSQQFSKGSVDGYPLYTIVADGDWTLYEARSHEDTFESSPARESVLAWIRSGIKTDLVGKKVFTHQLILTTGGDYQMASERFIAHLPIDVQPAVTLVTNSGARLFYYDQGRYQESSHYTTHALEGGVCFDAATEQAFITQAVSILNLFFSYLKTDLELQKEVTTAPYGEWVQAFAASYPEQGFSFKEFQEQGRILHGIHKTKDVCPRIEIRGLDEQHTVQISIVGMFSNLPALKKYSEFQVALKELGKHPGTILGQNLCVLEVSRTNKGTALHYLGIRPDLSCGIGDSPEGNDRPLMEYIADVKGVSSRMPFVSVASQAPQELYGYHLGNKVLGAKAFFEALVKEQQAHPERPFNQTIEACVKN